MTYTNSSTSSHKGKHLTYEERCQISILVHENYSNRHIANSIERAPQTINNEIKRGTIRQIRRQKQGVKFILIPTRFTTQNLHNHAMKTYVKIQEDVLNGLIPLTLLIGLIKRC